MDYTIPPGGQCNLEFGATGTAYSIPPGNQCDIEFGADKGESEPHAMLLHGLRCGWKQMRPVDGRCGIPWKPLVQRDKPVRGAWQDMPSVAVTPTRAPWLRTHAVPPPPTRALWRDLPHVVVPETRVPWQSPDALVLPSCRASWKQTRLRLSRPVRVPWNAPPALRLESTRALWTQLVPHNRPVTVPWMGTKPKRDRPYRIVWGKALYDLICLRGYSVPDGDKLLLNLDQPITQTGDGDHCNIWFDSLVYDIRCTQREPGGWRDNYLYRRNEWPIAPKLEVWIVLNTALLTRVSDRAPVEVYSMEISADIDSWCWSFTARVPAAGFELVMPLTEPVAVEANINGYVWRFLVESWTENRSFARREYTIRGRSLSAYLTAPYARAVAGSNEEEALARQLAAEQLQNTGWTLDWKICDWLVPAGALSYSAATPLKVIQQIAEAAGGRIISHATNQQLIALPRLIEVPWKWSEVDPVMGIHEYVVRTLNLEFIPGVSYNAVFVSGENQGVNTKVFRRGTAADELAPMVTDALITATEPATARGKLILGQSGDWSRVQMELPLTRLGTELPGLLQMGTLISMEERLGSQTSVWRGQIVAVKVTANWDRVFTVGQSIEVERYRGT